MKNFNAIKDYVFNELSNLDPKLRYHARTHTFEDVLPNSIILAREENLSEEETCIVTTAALFHDIGFLDQYDKNEPMGANRARHTLPEFGYSNSQIDQIVDCILATQVPQNPKTKLAKIVCDSDLCSLGSDNCFLRAEMLRLELIDVKGIDLPLKTWFQSQVRFFESHQYWTESAKKKYGETKQKNISQMKELL
ncbi:glutamyl-tRNA(Gln) amidotransferase subunit A, mitochondrial [Acrasis kona]|uniref:Glutamyl-tRNA(Gln) amidotransferase subunit A, mitochondrial n=1 Tax=Acrasis kona TaxID=1008807 RepID=A0AAW2ZK67_9EUKA